MLQKHMNSELHTCKPQPVHIEDKTYSFLSTITITIIHITIIISTQIIYKAAYIKHKIQTLDISYDVFSIQHVLSQYDSWAGFCFYNKYTLFHSSLICVALVECSLYKLVTLKRVLHDGMTRRAHIS